jgi:hypothetical protein
MHRGEGGCTGGGGGMHVHPVHPPWVRPWFGLWCHKDYASMLPELWLSSPMCCQSICFSSPNQSITKAAAVVHTVFVLQRLAPLLFLLHLASLRLVLCSIAHNVHFAFFFNFSHGFGYLISDTRCKRVSIPSCRSE